jgi:Immunoglobulin domain
MNLDDTASTICSVTKGDLPIHIWWTFVDDFNGLERNLSTNDGLMITRNSPKVSMLTIDAVKARHRGNYTCHAHNKAGISQHSAFLFINGLSKTSNPFTCPYNNLSIQQFLQFVSNSF